MRCRVGTFGVRTKTVRRVILISLGAAFLAFAVACSRLETGDGSHADHSRAERAGHSGEGSQSEGDLCPEHDVPETECGICKPDSLAKLSTSQGVKVRLTSIDSASIIGIQSATPKVGEITEGVDCYAEFAFDQNRLAQIVAPVGGILQDVSADLGDRVRERHVVARIWSAAIAEAMAKAVLTHQTLDRERKLHADRITSEKDLQEAEAAHRAACQQARTLGFSEEDIEGMRSRPNEAVYLEVRSPFAGEIVERTAVRGALVEAGRPLFTLADRSTVWAMLSIPDATLALVAVGQRVELRADSLPGKTFVGTLTWIGPGVDERTRMAQARAEMQNPDGLLRNKMFARARIVTRSSKSTVLVPASAIQKVAGKTVVFVKLADDLYEARVVDVGTRQGTEVEIKSGLDPDEPVAVARGFALKSQLLISRLGAGCADD